MYSEVQSKLFNELNNNTNITDLLDSFNSDFMIENSEVCPNSWELEKSTLNYYETNRDNYSKYDDITFTTNCRAFKYVDSKNIAEVIKTELHEKTVDNYIFTVVLLGSTLKPADERDNYNTIIDINVRQK